MRRLVFPGDHPSKYLLDCTDRLNSRMMKVDSSTAVIGEQQVDQARVYGVAQAARASGLPPTGDLPPSKCFCRLTAVVGSVMALSRCSTIKG